MATVRATERRLAVVTSWSMFGSFALALILSGFSAGSLVWGLAGFAVVLSGLVAHVLINSVYRTDFTAGEIVLGFIVFGIAVLSFLIAWLFDPAFGRANVIIGLAGFAAIVAAFLAYVVIRFGLRGAFSMFHELGVR